MSGGERERHLIDCLETAFKSMDIFKLNIWHLSNEGKEFANKMRSAHDDIKAIIEKEFR